ncbi:hypothetical protein G7Z17_g4723 [Cylindrodendrum hubeiense]|uniref:RelA/SpoT domain-containing protein n=1 Tax=Cylindrodendrum hubeiense TaxID=595255 RepID=A0A9P5HCA2_9HYPO|nr:hypothetical protein G7Z17_g4723 [Cylindrodendrum hubeiense]
MSKASESNPIKGITSALVSQNSAAHGSDTIPFSRPQPDTNSSALGNDPINEFIAEYERDFRLYDQIAKIAEEECRQALNESGIPAVITSRAKNPARLHEKVKERNKTENYTSPDAIRTDLADLSGVRIALYFPSQAPQVIELIDSLFTCHQIKDLSDKPAKASWLPFTKSPKKSGYCATHLRVVLGTARFPPTDAWCGHSTVEIQVASLLMHSWSEVNHDLDYKALSGDVSDSQRQLLTSLNKLVIDGEGILEKLKKSLEDRVAKEDRSFVTPFELSTFLQKDWKSESLKPVEYRMGTIKTLFYVIKHLGINNPKSLTERLKPRVPNPQTVSHALKNSSAQSILDYIFLYQGKGYQLDGSFENPFLRDDLNARLKDSKLDPIGKLGILADILAYAYEELPLKKSQNCIPYPPFPKRTGKKLQKSGVFINGRLIIQHLDDLQSDIRTSWEWFATSDDARLRIALGMGRAKKGEDFRQEQEKKFK